LESVISGQDSINEIIIKDYQGIDIIPGSSGIEQIADLTKAQTETLINAFLGLTDYDYFVFDTSAGISSQVISFCMASHEIILVATCEPTSLTDSYAMLKVLSKYGYDCPVKVIINQVRSGNAAQKAYARLKDTAKEFLSIKLEPLGVLAFDKNVRSAVISQTPFFMLFPDTIASKCIRNITGKIIKKTERTVDMPLEVFWDKCLAFLEKHQQSKKISVSDKEDSPAVETNNQTAIPENIQETDPEIKQALFQIESKLSALMEEVGEIKQFLDTHDFTPKRIPEAKDSAPGPFSTPTASTSTVPTPTVLTPNVLTPTVTPPAMPTLPREPEEIHLDFESWHLKKSQSS
jgi:flagellar biosynthesis protein FlhG